jgi:hypothetical protein
LDLRCLSLDRALRDFFNNWEPAVILDIGSDPVIHRVVLLFSFGFRAFFHGLLAGVLGLLGRRALRARRHFGIDGRSAFGSNPVVMHVRGGLRSDPVSKHDGGSHRRGLIDRRTASLRLSEPPGIAFT